ALTKRLADLGAHVAATGRTVDKAAHLQRDDVEKKRADLGSDEGWAEIFEGADTIFHVAAWLPRRGEDAEAAALKLNVDACERLYRLAADKGVRRFVHISTIAVFGLPPKDEVADDDALAVTQEGRYGRTKALGERALVSLAEGGGPELVVLRPGMVYGPRSQGWAIGMLKLVKKGTPVIFGDGQGYAFPVFIENLVDALVLAATAKDAAGAYNVVDEKVTWAEWFGAFGEMCGRKPKRLPAFMGRAIVGANALFKLGLPLDRESFELTQRRIVYPHGKLRAATGWAPRVSFQDGMAEAEAWLRAEGHLT
ncbi:MAG: NAD(P)-dependent oxidoreductase, partial [Gemmatimonadetes bacterium]